MSAPSSPSCPYSPECVEEGFSEVRFESKFSAVSLPARKKFRKRSKKMQGLSEFIGDSSGVGKHWGMRTRIRDHGRAEESRPLWKEG
jgi:hypothetical protein